MSPVAKISRVLVAVDFDEASVSALKVAGVRVSAWGARLTVFHSAMQEVPAYFTAAQLGGDVVRSLDIHQCAPDRLQYTDLVVLSMATESDTQAQLGAIVQVLKACIHPVLFVPSADGMFERSSS